ncbi:MAG: DUF2219 family protein [Rhodobacteraceae bacterium]|nr:DUF2219 family protein [Paracoccaceae bacterium]
MLIILALSALSTAPAVAQDDSPRLSFGAMFGNDAIGDGDNRWRTGSLVVSTVTEMGKPDAEDWKRGPLLEYRLRSEVISPRDLTVSDPLDRPYVGAVSVGVHSHFNLNSYDLSLGGDLVMTGPQTGLGDLHGQLSGFSGSPVLDDQVPNSVHPTVTVEAGRSFRLFDRADLTPFVEAQAGVETLIRVGGDMTVGRSPDGPMLRDVATGQRYTSATGEATGFSFVVGGDVAYVDSSAYLPASDGYVLTDQRSRVRAGVQWYGERSEMFYGMTWLGEEFEAQDEGQFVGSLNLRLRF